MLTVINSNGAITEVDLDKYNKKELRIGRDGSQCDIVIADPIRIQSAWHDTFGTFISDVQGRG